MFRRIYGFTLAELLITLGVIGIVAAITIPVLNNQIQDAQYKTAYKKAYSTLNQAFSTILSENGGTIKGLASTPNDFRDLFLAKMAYVKKCDWTETKGGCWNNVGAYRFDGVQFQNDDWWFNLYDPSAVLKDGMSLLFDYNYDVYACDNSAGSHPFCANIFVDTNGLKKPNVAGKDIFWFTIYENRIVQDGDGSTCTDFNCGSYYMSH